MNTLNGTHFDPVTEESAIRAGWRRIGVHRPSEDESASAYSIAIPPPNVTGALHMGHALNCALQDVLIRRQRMLGRRVKWILGTDHAGIATQTQVERQLAEEGTDRHALGRQAFVQRIWDWRKDYGTRIVDQFECLGVSADYDDERFTLDPQYAQAVTKVFVDLYDKGYIYRDFRIVNWDPGSRSAISDLEVEEAEVTDVLYYVAYPLADAAGEVVVATVRPETILADVAIAVNPDDDRHAHLVGRTAVLPLTGRELPIITDGYVKPSVGTGCLKVTPAHDPNDFEIGRRHGLEEPQAIAEDGRMTDLVPRFAGMTVAEAREAVVAELGERGVLRGEEPITHAVPFSQRSGLRIEPLISLQWFMKMDELAAPAIAAVEQGRIRIHPETESRRYVRWLKEIQPWCISRQLWWGHQLPVWYRGEDEVYVGHTPPVGDGWERDPDVLDTWFSSALWPFATLGWPRDTTDLKSFYPTDALFTARDILFLWVARMVMLGVECVGEIPFSDVYVHSVIQAPDGRRMSKSLGTGIDPLDVTKGGPRPEVFKHGGDFPPYGTDALRFGLLAMASMQDVRFSEERIAQGRSLVNKLFSLTRLMRGLVGEREVAGPRPRTLEDRWIVSRVVRRQRQTDACLAAFEFSRLALGLRDFIHVDVSEWYVEIAKRRVVDDDLAATLMWVLRQTLVLAHPILPFVTEHLWGSLPGPTTMLAAERVTTLDEALIDADAEAEFARVIEVTSEVRAWRESVAAPPRRVLRARVPLPAEAARAVATLARLDIGGHSHDEPRAVVTATAAAVEILDDVVDRDAVDRARDAQRRGLMSQIERTESKLANRRFVTNAPGDIVSAERDKLTRLQHELEAL